MIFKTAFQNSGYSFIHSPGLHKDTPEVNLSVEVNIQHLLQVVLSKQANYKATLMMIETHILIKSQTFPYGKGRKSYIIYHHLSLLWKASPAPKSEPPVSMELYHELKCSWQRSLLQKSTSLFVYTQASFVRSVSFTHTMIINWFEFIYENIFDGITFLISLKISFWSAHANEVVWCLFLIFIRLCSRCFLLI